MQVELVTTTEGLASLRETWESLEDKDTHAPYYVTHRFVTAWWDAFSRKPGVDLHVVCVRQNNALVGVLPLSVRTETRDGAQVRILRFASHGDYLGPLVDPAENADTVLKKAMGFLEENVAWDRVNLAGIPGTSPFAAFLLKSAYNRSLVFLIENPYLDLTPFADFGQLAAQGLPAHTRKYRNKFFRECDLSFRVVRGDDEGIFERVAELHRLEKRFLVEEKSRDERHSLYEDPFRREHIRNVFTRTGDALTFCYESSQGELLGYRTCFLHGRTLLSWNSAYHPDHDHYRLGKIIQYDILEHVLAEDLADVFDFGAGRYPWKFEWTGTFTPTYRLRAIGSTPKPAPAAASASAVGPRSEAGAAPQVSALPADEPGPGPAEPPRPSRMVRQAQRLGRMAGPGRIGRRAGRVLASVQARTSGPVIWYAPHPDDETLFMGASIRQSQEGARGRRSILVVLTRGGASPGRKVDAKLGRTLTRAEFMQARVTELRAAARVLGVAAGDLVLHDLPDGGLEARDVRAVMAEMARRHPRASHRTMSYLDPHPDHRAAGEALRSLHREGVVTECVFHLPVPLVDERLGSEVTVTGSAAVAAKRAAIREYQRWDPEQGRYAVGYHSVPKLMRRQARDPMERVHGPDLQG